MFFLLEIIVFCVCAVVCVMKMAQVVSGRGNTPRSTGTVNVLSNVLVNPTAATTTAGPSGITHSMETLVDFDVEELIHVNANETLPQVDQTDLEQVLTLLGTGEQQNGTAERSTSNNAPDVNDVVLSDVPQRRINSSATEDVQRPAQRISKLSLNFYAPKGVSQSAVGSTSGSEASTSVKENTNRQPREDGANDSMLRTLLTRQNVLPAQRPGSQIVQKAAADIMEKGKRPINKKKQVAKNSSGSRRNVGPVSGCSSAALPLPLQRNVVGNASSALPAVASRRHVGSIAGSSGAAVSASVHRDHRQTPIRITVSSSDSESEFDVFSQEDDRQLLNRFKRRCREVDADYERSVALGRGLEDALRHAEATVQGVDEHLRRLEEERQRLVEERQRAEEEVDSCRARLEEHQRSFSKADKKRRLMRRVFDR